MAVAEGHAGGRASKAEIEKSRGRWVFDVEVVKDRTVTDVHVDASDGKVISASEDRADNDDHGDKDD